MKLLLIVLLVIKQTASEPCSNHQTCGKHFMPKGPTAWLGACSCEDSCFQFGDCCPDILEKSGQKLEDWSFLYATYDAPQKFIWSGLLRSKCPQFWPANDKVRNLCENTGFDEELEALMPEFGHLLAMNSKDEFLTWPVTSKFTNVTYRNLYCATCHNERKELVSWIRGVNCFDGKLCEQITYEVPPPYVLQSLQERTFHRQHIMYSSCEIGWYKNKLRSNKALAIELVKKCALFLEPLVLLSRGNYYVFKNKFCVECNGLKSKEFLCPSSLNASVKLRRPVKTGDTVSFDPNFENGGKIGRSEERCKKGYVWDLFNGFCRQVWFNETIQTGDTFDTSGKLLLDAEGIEREENDGDLEFYEGPRPKNSMPPSSSSCVVVCYNRIALLIGLIAFKCNASFYHA